MRPLSAGGRHCRRRRLAPSARWRSGHARERLIRPLIMEVVLNNRFLALVGTLGIAACATDPVDPTVCQTAADCSYEAKYGQAPSAQGLAFTKEHACVAVTDTHVFWV